jgi:hypothetical protein
MIDYGPDKTKTGQVNKERYLRGTPARIKCDCQQAHRKGSEEDRLCQSARVLVSEALRIGEEQPQDDHRTDQTDQSNVLHGQIIPAPCNYPTASLFAALSGFHKTSKVGHRVKSDDDHSVPSCKGDLSRWETAVLSLPVKREFRKVRPRRAANGSKLPETSLFE